MSLPEKERDLGLGQLAAGAEEDFLEANSRPVFIGHFDADGVLARNRRDDADARHAHVQGEVVAEVGDLVDAHAGFQGDFVLRDHRPRVDADHADVELEILEGLFQQRRPLA